MRLQERIAPFDNLTDEELTNLIIIEIIALEAQGVSLPTGWRFQAGNFNYLNLLLKSAIKQLKDMIQQGRNSRAQND